MSGSRRQLRPSGTPSNSGTLVNFANSITPWFNAPSSERGNIQNAAANTASSANGRPRALYASKRRRTPADSSAAPPTPSAASRGICSSICATIEDSISPRSGGTASSAQPLSSSNARRRRLSPLIGPPR